LEERKKNAQELLLLAPVSLVIDNGRMVWMC